MKAKNLNSAVFNYSWEVTSTMYFFNKLYQITISADAYYDTEKITGEQIKAYHDFLMHEKQILSKVEKFFVKELGSKKNAVKNFTPKVLKIQKNGDMALLFDDVNDLEAGIVICITPTLKMMDIDQYL